MRHLKAKIKRDIKVCDGNRAAAYAVLLSKPDVVALYPVTPQTPLVENLSRFHAEGLLDCEMVEVEGENSAMGVLLGASACGGRVFTATSGLGLSFMHDAYQEAGLARLPIVMANVTRETFVPANLFASEQDIMSELDSGWVHIHVDNCQEILDSIIMAYRLAEDPEIRLAVTVVYDGFFLSYLSEPVEIPPQEDVDGFLIRRPSPARLSIEQPMAFNVGVGTEGVTLCRRKHLETLERAKTKLDEIDNDFSKVFGRSYGGQIEEYRMEDADIALLTLGSCTGTARKAINQKREAEIKVGLVKVRLFRPFPQEKLVQALKGKKAIGVIDRNVCFGWNCGHLFMELKSALYGSGVDAPAVNFIDGIGGGDITLEHIKRAIDITYEASQGKSVRELTWLLSE